MNAVILLLSAWAPVVADEAASSAFVDLSFEKALALAKEKDKPVMIDFYTTWCGPCKKLDHTTWKDAKVREWLRAKTVALKIDAEKQRRLAKKYGINAYPTMIFINADGSIKGQLVGYHDPEKFLAGAKDLLDGVTPRMRLEEQYRTTPDDPMLRMKLAGELAREDKHAAALEHYLWCLDHGAEKSPEFVGVRLSYLPMQIAALGREYAPARAALVERRDTAGKRLRETPAKARHEDVQVYAALNKNLREADKTLELCEHLLKAEPLRPELLRPLLGDVLDPLLEARRYKDLLRVATDVPALVATQRAMLDDTRKHFQGQSSQGRLEYMVQKYREKCSKLYEAALGADDPRLAERILYQAIRGDDSLDMYALLARHARRAKGDAGMPALLASARKSLADAEYRQFEASLDQAR